MKQTAHRRQPGEAESFLFSWFSVPLGISEGSAALKSSSPPMLAAYMKDMKYIKNI
jgi:hypothetical protein